MGDRPFARLDVDSKPGVAPLSRAYPRLVNAVPSGLSRRFATKLKDSPRLRDQMFFWQEVPGKNGTSYSDGSTIWGSPLIGWRNCVTEVAS